MANNLNAATYQNSLDGMLEALFRPVDRNGYWSESEGRILRALEFSFDSGGKLHWRPDQDERFRYGPMALMGIVMWRCSDLAHERFDEKLLRNLTYYRQRLDSPDVLQKVPSYGAGPLIYAFSRSHDLWPDQGFDQTAELLSNHALNHYSFSYNEDSLVLMGLAARSARLSPAQREALRSAAASLRAIQDEDGLYCKNEYRTAFKHQNQMYTIWGLGHCDIALGENESELGIRRCLQYTVDHRMLDDGALLWHDYRNWMHRLYGTLLTTIGRVPEPIRLYSCHQAFFVYAVQVYRHLSGKAVDFVAARDNAMRWEYGQNVIGQDLFERSGIGVPMRIMLTSGRLDVPTQRFIGIYEIGAMIMCMVELLQELGTGEKALEGAAK